MKKKHAIITVFLSLAVLFSILFQSVHAYGHHSEQILVKVEQQFSKNKVEINKNQSIVEKCFACDFSFSSCTTPDFLVLDFLKNKEIKTSISLFSPSLSSFFKGCLFSLRGPPAF